MIFQKVLKWCIAIEDIVLRSFYKMCDKECKKKENLVIWD